MWCLIHAFALVYRQGIFIRSLLCICTSGARNTLPDCLAVLSLIRLICTHFYVYDTSANRVLNTKPPKNNTSGYRGVSWHKKTSKWHAALQYRGVIYSLGYYDNIEDAAEAYRIAKNNAINDFSEWYSKHYPEQWERKNKKLRRDKGAE